MTKKEKRKKAAWRRKAGKKSRGLQNFFGSEWIMDGITSNRQVRLKCKKWLDEAKSTEKVQLVCVVSGHKVATTYKPEKLAEYMATAKTGSVNKK